MIINATGYTGRLRPKFRELVDARRMQQMAVSRYSGIPYQTIQNYYNGGQDMRGVRLNVLYAFLRGLNYSDEEILDMRIGELFDIVEE